MTATATSAWIPSAPSPSTASGSRLPAPRLVRADADDFQHATFRNVKKGTGYEVMVPFQALSMLGYVVHAVCPERRKLDGPPLKPTC